MSKIKYTHIKVLEKEIPELKKVVKMCKTPIYFISLLW